MMSFPRHRRPLLALFFLLAMGALFFSEMAGSGPLTASIFDGGGLIGGLNQAKAELTGTGIRTNADVIVAIGAIINFVFLFVGIFAFIAFVTAGFFFILGFGSDQANQRAKKIMIYAAIGLVVIIFAFVLTTFIVEVASAP